MNNAIGHASTISVLSAPKSIVFAVILMAGAGIAAQAAAQSIAPPPAAAARTNVAWNNSDGHPPTKELIKTGEGSCLQQTGSLLPPKKGHCLPVPGRSYSGEELRSTGAFDNARSLQMLDPSITRGH